MSSAADEFPLGYVPGPEGEEGHWTLRFKGGPATLENLAAAAQFLSAGLHLGSPLREPVARLMEGIEEVQDIRHAAE